MGSELAEVVHARDGAMVPSELVASAQDYARASRAPSTLKAYNSDWRRFVAQCQARGLCPLPAAPATVALYLAARADAGKAVATIERELAAISQAHKRAGCESPRSQGTVQEVLKGIKRRVGTAQRRAAPLLADDIRALVEHLPENLHGRRDRALLLLGFAGALRRSELVALDVADLFFELEGVRITIRRSKTDQVAEGVGVGVPFGANPASCPVRALRAWLDALGVADGRVFRSVSRHGRVGAPLHGRDVARIIKQAALAANIDASLLSGHSLRAGLATQAAISGKADRSIMRQGRWRSRTMVDRYVRDASLFEGNAAAGIGL